MALGKYLGAGSGTTKALFHLNGNANDSSGNGYNGFGTNITWVGGIGGGSASFLTALSSSINYGNILGYEINQAITHSIWYNTSTSGLDMVLFSKMTYIGFYGYLLIQNSSNNKISFILAQSGSIYFAMDFPTVINDGKWHNIIITYDGSSTLAGIKGYIDGRYIVSGNRNSGTPTTITNTNVFSLGARLSTTKDLFYTGFLDEYICEPLRVWTPTEIQKQYTYGKGRFGIL